MRKGRLQHMFTWLTVDKEMTAIIIGILFGIISRVFMLKTDYRQYPTYPHGKIIHLSLGAIAAGLGAVAIPALINKDYTAITFLALGAQQFRDVRKMERESLSKADEMELVPRGVSFIEGIAMVFEGRNYLVIFCALIASGFAVICTWHWGVAAGIAGLITSKIFQSGKTIKQIAKIVPAEVRVEGADLYIDQVYIMNIGLAVDQELVRQHGLGLMLLPMNRNAKVTIANLGQRQAILHNLSTILGVYRDSGEPALMPMAKLDLDSGNLALFILPRERDMSRAVQVAGFVPVLEIAVRMPSESPSATQGAANDRKEA